MLLNHKVHGTQKIIKDWANWTYKPIIILQQAVPDLYEIFTTSKKISKLFIGSSVHKSHFCHLCIFRTS